MTEFFPPSEKALKAAATRGPSAFNGPKYPWADLPKGKSFATDDKSANIKSLKPHASRMGKKFNKQFRVIEHDACYEIYCLTDEEMHKAPVRQDDNAG